MKKILFTFAFLICVFISNAQTWNNIFGHFSYEYFRATKSLRPIMDTLASGEVGSLAYKNDVWYGKKSDGIWKAVGGIPATKGLDSVLFQGDSAYQKDISISWDTRSAAFSAGFAREFFHLHPDSTGGYISIGDVNGNRTNFFLIMSQRSVGFEADSGLLIKAGGNSQFTQLMTQAAQSGAGGFIQRIMLPYTTHFFDTLATVFDVRTASNLGIDAVLARLQQLTADRIIRGGLHAFSFDSVSVVNINRYGIAVSTINEGLILENKTPSTVGNPYQYSPAVHWIGRAFTGGVDTKTDWRVENRPAAFGMGFVWDLVFEYALGGGAYSEAMRLKTNPVAITTPLEILVGTGPFTTITGGTVSSSSIGVTTLFNLTNTEVTSGPYSIVTPRTTVTSGTFTTVLPSVGSNSNIYRITNIGSGTTTVGTTSSQNITNGLTTATTWTLTQGKFVEVCSSTGGSLHWIVQAYN